MANLFNLKIWKITEMALWSYDLIEIEQNKYRVYTSSSLQKTICYCNELNSDFELIDSYTIPWYFG